MQDAEFLFIVAEVAVAFAGFASVVAVLGQRSTRDHPRLDASRLRGLLECSLVVVAFSLFPYAATRFFADDAVAWRLSSGLFAAVALRVAVGMLRRRRQFAGIPISRGIQVTIIALYIAPIPPLLLIAAGAISERGPATFLLCLLIYLFAAGFAFFRVMISFIAAVRE
jgi:hypothetical protein